MMITPLGYTYIYILEVYHEIQLKKDVYKRQIYGILFRDINMQRTLVDQFMSRVIIGYCGIMFNSGEDNYLTTDDAIEAAHTVTASQFINEQFAVLANIPDCLLYTSRCV